MKRKPLTLIVTKSDDNDSIERVAGALKRRGRLPVRVDTDRYPLEITSATRFDPDHASVSRTLTTESGEHDLNLVEATWYRRYMAGAALPNELGDMRPPAVDEARRALYGLIAALPGRQLDRLEDVRRCDHKELQMVLARTHGLTTPRTLFSNDPRAVREFFDACNGRVITKMQSSFAIIRGGQEHVVFTNVVEREHLADLDGLRYCPMVFQELIDKRLEIRSTVVGDRVYSAAVDSQRQSLTKIDWRKDGVGLLKAWKKYTLPTKIERAVIGVVHAIGLRYGACDFILTPEGEHVFLEVNAGGEWMWLDDLLGISNAIADELTR